MKKIVALLLALIMVLAASALAEGSLVLYYSHAADWSDPIIKGFEEKYDVQVEMVGLGTGELVGLGLFAADDRDGEVFLVEVGVDVQHTLGLFDGLLRGGVQGMALLPQEFTVTQERTGSLLPAQNGAPLVILHGQVTMALQHMGKMLTEQSLGSGTDCVLLFQTLAAAQGDPCALGSKALNMVLLLLQQGFGNQQRHIDVLNALLLELLVHDVLDILPDGIAVGTVNEDTLDGRVVDQLCLLANVGEPLSKVDLHIGDLLNLFIFCHCIFILSVFFQFIT